MTDTPLHTALQQSEDKLKHALEELAAAASISKPASPAPKRAPAKAADSSKAPPKASDPETDADVELHEEIRLLYEEARDIYTRLAGLRAEAAIGLA